MMLGTLTFLLALGASVYLLIRVADETRRGASSLDREQGETDKRAKLRWFQDKENLLKLIVLLALCAALFTAKLWPLALMLLVAAGCITAVEFWRQGAASTIEMGQQDREEQKSEKFISLKEAYEILGLEEGASKESIRSAHKNLIAQLHPDRGGTDYLAAKINESRVILLAEIEKKSN